MIVGITGRAGAGKSTLAQEIQKPKMFTPHTKGIRIKGFSVALKKSVAAMFGINWELLEDQSFKASSSPLGITWRELLQKFGTEAVRNGMGENFWIDVLMSEYIPNTSKWIIQDVRFDNEAQAIRDRGGIIIRIERDNLIDVGTHASEAGVSEHLVDETWVNNRGIEEIKMEAARLAEYFKTK